MASKKKIFKIKTVKKEKAQDRKLREQVLTSRTSHFLTLSNNELIDKSKDLILNLCRNTINDDESITYEALVNAMEQKNLQNDNIFESKYKYYPHYSDTRFNEKIYKKIEFYLNKNFKQKKMNNIEKEILSKQLCDPLYETITGEKTKEDVVFNLTKNQKFLKAFLGPDTPYNSMLLYHGTGVGKTCTSISIAEQYMEEIESTNKKVVILLNPSIKANFMKNIFNLNKLKSGMTYYQCTGEKYLKEIPDYKKLLETPEVLERKINKLIKKRYSFYGYQQFSNLIEKMKKEIQEKYSNDLQKKIFRDKIRNLFSDTVFIVDEVHNIKESNDLKVLPPLLEEVFSLTQNMKLLLLSATPMFDTSREIIYLMNLLLINDNKPKMNVNNYFDSNNNIYSNKINDFLKKTKGYISYVRGENPYRFPFGIYPEEQVLKKNQFPTKDNLGVEIKEDLRIKDLKIIPCEMKSLQKQVYALMENDTKREDVKKKSVYGAFNQPALMCSNMVFPIDNHEDLDEEDFRLGSFIGDVGFESIIQRNKVNKKLKFSYKNDEIKSYFDFNNIKNYSTKIHKILDNIKKSKGVVFVYSQFLASGILPLSLALENLGYKKYGDSLLTTKYESKETKGHYIIISGNNELSKNAYADYIKIENKNIDGSKVKVIIGSETAAEGLDFRYIREIHILEPWFHLNKIDQIIGRGIRNCSHIELPNEDRNVKIFLYASTKSLNPNKDNETLDLKIYRNAENKSVQMGKIEYLLKTNAVDCNLNIESNKYETDIDYSKKCNYEKCNYVCNPNLKEKLLKTELDYDTINDNILGDQINDIIKIIKFGSFNIKPLFKVKYYYNLNEILDIINGEKIVIFLALHKLITQEITLFDKYNNESHLTFSNGNYILIPNYKKNRIMTYNNLKSRKNNRVNRLNISNSKVLNHIYSKDNDNNNSFEANNIPKRNKSVTLSKKFSIVKNINKNNSVKNNRNNSQRNNNITISSMMQKTVNDIKEKLINVNKLSFFTNKIKKDKKNDIILDKLEKMNEKIFEYGNIMDYLKPNAKEILIKYLIKKHKTKQLNNEESILFDNCYNILYTKNDVYYKDLSYKGSNELFGYKIIENGKLKYYKLVQNSFIRANTEESKAIEKSTLKKVNENIDKKPPSILCGYLEHKMPANEVLFKIRDKKSEGKKGTQIKTGSVCNNDGMKKNKVVTYIQIINEMLSNIEKFSKNNNYKDAEKKNVPGKEFLCYELELYFRYLDIIDVNYRYFYNSEETLEYKLNEK